MDFMGKQASAVDPKIPDADMPAYSAHGSLTRVSDGMSLEEAIQALDSPMNFVIARTGSYGWANLFFTATRTQPLLIMARVDRTTTKSLSGAWADPFVAYGTEYHGDVEVAGTLYTTREFVLWNGTTTTFRVLFDGNVVDSQSILIPDSSATMFGSWTATPGNHNITVSHVAGQLGTLAYSEILIAGVHAF